MNTNTFNDIKEKLMNHQSGLISLSRDFTPTAESDS
jgi:hypothetical protein